MAGLPEDQPTQPNIQRPQVDGRGCSQNSGNRCHRSQVLSCDGTRLWCWVDAWQDGSNHVHEPSGVPSVPVLCGEQTSTGGEAATARNLNHRWPVHSSSNIAAIGTTVSLEGRLRKNTQTLLGEGMVFRRSRQQLDRAVGCEFTHQLLLTFVIIPKLLLSLNCRELSDDAHRAY